MAFVYPAAATGPRTPRPRTLTRDLRHRQRVDPLVELQPCLGPMTSQGPYEERATGVEPATSSLGSWHSTTELRPQRPETVAHSCSPRNTRRPRALP